MTTITDRIGALDWNALAGSLDERGFAVTPPLLDARGVRRRWPAAFDGDGFRSTVEMARHRFGDGRYRYFDHPLPDPIPALRSGFYEQLAPIANTGRSACAARSRRSPRRTASCSSAAAPRARSGRRR